MFEKFAAGTSSAPAEVPMPTLTLKKRPTRVDLDMGEGSRLQGFKLNGSR